MARQVHVEDKSYESQPYKPAKFARLEQRYCAYGFLSYYNLLTFVKLPTTKLWN